MISETKLFAGDVSSAERLDATMAENTDVEIIDICDVTWERPKSVLCDPHKCDLPKYHEGPHECSCGWKRRLMYRDEPERFDEKLR